MADGPLHDSARRPLRTVPGPGDRLDAARRRLLADWCRLVGQRLAAGEPMPNAIDASRLAAAARFLKTAGGGPAPAPAACPNVAPPADPLDGLHLAPRARQILDRLLHGDSEKQIAIRLQISPHTVHTYIKQLHKTLDVNSRGELLAKFVARTPPVRPAGRTA